MSIDLAPEQSALYPHLHPYVVPLLDADDKTRILHAAKVEFIEHTQATYLLDRLEQLYEQPLQDRMDGLLIAGPTFSGKTHLVREFESRYPRDPNLGGDHVIQTVAYALAPDKPDVDELHRVILKAIGGGCLSNEKALTVRERVLTSARACGLKMLFLDEIHGVLNGSPSRQRHIMSVIKNLSNIMQVSIVLLGTREAFIATSAAVEVQSRFPAEWLPGWETDDEEFKGLLRGFEQQLPLRKASHLRELSALLHEMCEGSLGWLSRLLAMAARTAIKSGEERITAELLSGLRWVPPSKRRLDDGEAAT